MHEYTHAVTDYVAHLTYGYTEVGAIHEGNSDYFAGTFTGRTLILEYAAAVYQRDMLSPRIATYSAYQARPDWPSVEPHDGGELWSASLWDLRSHPSITQYYSDRVTYGGLFGIPTNSSFLQYRQAIINADRNNYGGVHEKFIAHIFYVRGIGYDSVGVTITGPTYLLFKQYGTYTANPSVGSGNFGYQWYVKEDGGSWITLGTTQQQTYRMGLNNFTIRCDVHDNTTGENATGSLYVQSDGGFRIADVGLEKQTIAPESFAISQNYPNPFNPETAISFALPEAADVRITVSDILGRELITLQEARLSPGYHSTRWRGVDGSGNPVGSGIYFYHIRAVVESGKTFVKTMKMALTR